MPLEIMADSGPRVTIVCPAFEEADGLPFFHSALAQVLDGLDHLFTFEILYVDDGSRDGTLDVLRDLARRDPRVRYLSLSRNFGKEAALLAGLQEATGEAVISLDADLQHPPELLPQFLEHWREGYDVVVGQREDDPVGCFKGWTSRLFYRVFNALSPTPLPVATSDFQLLSRKAVDALLRCREAHRLTRGLVGWLGFPAVRVPFRPAPRSHGTTKYSSERLLGLAADALLSFSRWPLRLALGLGGLLLLAGPLLLLGGTVHQFLAGGTPWLLLILLGTMTLLNGCVLLAVGLLGEYVGRIYEQVKGRPLYLFKETSEDPVPALEVVRR